MTKKELTKEELEKVTQIYNLHQEGTPLEQACNSVGYTRNQYYIRRKIAKRQGIEFERVKQVNSQNNYAWFRSIDTQDKAYFLGLLAADGCITPEVEGHSSKKLSLKLKASDGYLVEKLCSYISPEREPITVPYDGEKKFGYDCEDSVIWRANSDMLVEDLLNLGLNYRKSYTGIAFPYSIDKDLYRHYIRGYFDGNGYISVSYSKRDEKDVAVVAILSTDKIFLKDLESVLPVSSTIVDVTKSDRETSLFKLYVKRHWGLKMLKYYLYTDADTFLHRKKEKFDKAIPC